MGMLTLFGLVVFGLFFITGMLIDILSFTSVVVRKLFVKYDIGNSKPPATVIMGVLGICVGFFWPILIVVFIFYYLVIIPLAKFIDNFPYTISVKRREG